jgi:chemotaxis protein MotB
MSNPRRYNNRVSHERWLVSYADFITLMFAFFVVMFSSARMDKDKMVQLTQAIESGFQQLGANAPAKARPQPPGQAEASAKTPAARLAQADARHKPEDFAAIQKELEKLLSPEIKRREVALRMESDGLIISLREIGFFDSGSAQIKPQAIGAVHRIAGFLQGRNCGLRIEGHTDNVPIHTASFASNWELSTARATGLVKLLIEAEGFAPGRLSAAGYGEFHPVAENSSITGQQLNRRVDIVVVPEVVPASQISMGGTPGYPADSPAKPYPFFAAPGSENASQLPDLGPN